MKTEVFLHLYGDNMAQVAVVVNRKLTEMLFVDASAGWRLNQAHFGPKTATGMVRDIHDPTQNWKVSASINVRDEAFASDFISGEFFAQRLHSLMTRPEFAETYAKMPDAAKPRKQREAQPDNAETKAKSKRGRPKKVDTAL